MIKSVEMMEKVIRERLQDGLHSEYADHYCSQKLYKQKQKSLKVIKINLLQWVGQKCNMGKLAKLSYRWMEGKRHKRRWNTFFVTKRH